MPPPPGSIDVGRVHLGVAVVAIQGVILVVHVLPDEFHWASLMPSGDSPTWACEPLAPLAVARGILGHLAKLHQARGRMVDGMSADDAVRGVRPPIFFKRVPDFTRALRQWDAAKLAAAMRETRRVELMCKQTGAPDLLLVRRLLSVLTRQGRASR